MKTKVEELTEKVVYLKQALKTVNTINANWFKTGFNNCWYNLVFFNGCTVCDFTDGIDSNYVISIYSGYRTKTDVITKIKKDLYYAESGLVFQTKLEQSK